MRDISAIAQAATTIVLRDGSAGLEVLLLRRARKLAFHGGAWVFPGGRVDPEDARDSLHQTARVAAIRETHEEAGLILRDADLVPFSHWTTPEGRVRRFATWFFVSQVDPNVAVRVDGGEIDAHRWITPQLALELQAAQELELPPPTFVSLCVLAGAASVSDVLDRSRGTDPFIFHPRPRPAPHGVVSLYGGDVAYEGGDVEAPGPRHRLCMFERGWRYERAE